MAISFTELKTQFKKLNEIRDELHGIKDLYEEKNKESVSLKNDIKRGGLSGKYKELELVEVTQNIEYIRIAFDKKYKEFDKLKASIEPSKIIDLRYREIKQREYEALENYNRVDKILQECEEKERKLEEICKEYEDIKTETLVLNNRTTRYDY